MRMKQLEKAMKTGSQDAYNAESIRLLKEIDAMSDLNEDMRYEFHRRMAILHVNKKKEIVKGRRWFISLRSTKIDDIYMWSRIMSPWHMEGKITFNVNDLFGCLVLGEERTVTEIREMFDIENADSRLNIFICDCLDFKRLYKSIESWDGIAIKVIDEELRDQIISERPRIKFQTQHSKYRIY